MVDYTRREGVTNISLSLLKREENAKRNERWNYIKHMIEAMVDNMKVKDVAKCESLRM